MPMSRGIHIIFNKSAFLEKARNHSTENAIAHRGTYNMLTIDKILSFIDKILLTIEKLFCILCLLNQK